MKLGDFARLTGNRDECEKIRFRSVALLENETVERVLGHVEN